MYRKSCFNLQLYNLYYNTLHFTIHLILLYNLHYNSPSFVIHLLLQKSLHCNKTLNCNTPLIEIHPTLQYTLYYINVPLHYDIPTLQFTPHKNTPHITIHLMLHCTPHYNTPTLQYTPHYNIKRGSLFKVELILKLKIRLQYVYYQYLYIYFAKVIH